MSMALVRNLQDLTEVPPQSCQAQELPTFLEGVPEAGSLMTMVDSEWPLSLLVGGDWNMCL